MVDPTPSERNTQTNTTLLLVGGVALYLLFGIALWWALDQYIDPDSAKVPSTAKKDLFQGWGFIMAGVAAGIGIYVTWRTQRLGYETLRNDMQDLQQRAKTSQQLLQLTTEGMQMQSFGAAVPQLGATDETGRMRIENRLGAIYSLEGLAKSSQTLHPAILQMLTGYVRTNAPWPQPGGYLEEPSIGEDERADPAVPAAPPIDIQAILDVLGRREEATVRPKDRVPLDLRRTDLRGADLQGDFRGVWLYKAELRGARLQLSNLQEADLQSANLQRADLRGADLQGANLYEANLQKANLQGANVTDKQLVNTMSLRGATMPDGQALKDTWTPDGPTFEDWLKDKEGGEKDVEND
jgi:hypothetical protein